MRPQPLALGSEAFQPEARGYIWDLRGEVPTPLDYEKLTFSSHLNAAGLHRVLADCADRELVEMLTGGARIKAQLQHQIVIMPSLLSLYTDVGADAVADEIAALEERSWYGATDFIPFAPWRASPRGAVPRPNAAARHRRPGSAAARRRG